MDQPPQNHEFPRLSKAISGYSSRFPNMRLKLLKNARSEHGSAIIMALMFMLVATFLITIGARLVSDNSRSTKQRELFVGQAENVARAGLIDALSWFDRTQTNSGYVSAYPASLLVNEGQTGSFQAGISYVDQPFEPKCITVNAQLSDTLDPNVGIVNDYPLDNGDPNKALYFARYEVRRQDPLHPDPSQTATPWVAGTPTATPDPMAVHDVTGNRNSQGLVNGDGFAWSVVSTGYVYKRMDKTGGYPYWTVAYNQYPNKVLAKAVFGTELRKFNLQMPSSTPSITGGIYCQLSGQVTLSNNNCLVNGAVSTTGTYAVVAQQRQ